LAEPTTEQPKKLRSEFKSKAMPAGQIIEENLDAASNSALRTRVDPKDKSHTTTYSYHFDTGKVDIDQQWTNGNHSEFTTSIKQAPKDVQNEAEALKAKLAKAPKPN
jgi:hypothetical protein